MKIARRGMIALIIALLELSLLPVLLDIAGVGIGSVQLLFYAFLVASFVSVPIAFFYDRAGLFSLFKSRKSIAVIAVAGLFNNAISQLLLAIGTIGTNPSIGGIVFRSWILIFALMMPFALKLRVSKKQMAAILVGFIGVYLVVSNGTLLSINSQQLPYMAILLGCAFFSAAAMLMMRLHNVSTTAAIALFNIASVIFLGAIAFIFHIGLSVPFSMQTIGIILFLGTATYGIGTTLYYYSVKTLNPIFVGNATLAVPFLTILLSSVIVGTALQPYYIYSAILIVGAVLAQQKFSGAAPKRLNKNSKDMQLFDVTGAFISNRKITSGLTPDSKALATIVAAGAKLEEQMPVFQRRNVIAFTSTVPHQDVSKDEVEFINDIVAPKIGETVLVGIGNGDAVEEAFDEFIKNQKTINNL